jgi:hypothetical protein
MPRPDPHEYGPARATCQGLSADGMKRCFAVRRSDTQNTPAPSVKQRPLAAIDSCRLAILFFGVPK